MVDGVTIKIEGVDELKRALAEAAADIRKKAVRGALREAGKVIQAAARTSAPVLKTKDKRRTPGTVKKNIVVRISKFAQHRGDAGVYVGVRGIRGKARISRLGRAGANNPNDPYYWWWQEFGWVPRNKKIGALKGGTRRRGMQRSASGISKIQGKRFMTNSANNYGDRAIAKFMQSVVPQINKLNQRKK